MPENVQKINFVRNLHDFVKTKVADGVNNLPKHLPGHISKILKNDFVEFTIDAVGPYTLPKLTVPQAFSKYHREPTKVGDKGYVVGATINIGGSSGNDGSTANMYQRGNLTTGTFHPISNKNFPVKDPDQFLVTGGSKGHKVQSEDTKTSTTIDDAGKGKIDHVAAKGVTTKATSGDIAASAMTGDVTHAAAQGAMKLVANSFTVGKAADPNAFPPVPSLPTVFNIIGSMSSSGNSSSSGTMSAAGGIVGAPGGTTQAAGNVGQVISSIVSTPITIAVNTALAITSIPLTAGDWDIHAEVWAQSPLGVSSTGFYATISNVAGGGIIFGPSLITNSCYFTMTIPPSTTITLPLRTTRANILIPTTYYLYGQINGASGNGTLMGDIWARRAI